MLRLKQCSACCVSVGPKLVWSCRHSAQVAPLWTWLRLLCASHGFNLGPMWIALRPTSAQHGHLVPTWAPAGFKIAQLDQVGTLFGAAGPNPGNFADSMWHAENLHFTAISNVFWLWWGHWAQLPRQMPPHRTKLGIQTPTCIQTCPSCAMLDPSWAQVGSELGPTGFELGPRCSSSAH